MRGGERRCGRGDHESPSHEEEESASAGGGHNGAGVTMGGGHNGARLSVERFIRVAVARRRAALRERAATDAIESRGTHPVEELQERPDHRERHAKDVERGGPRHILPVDFRRIRNVQPDAHHPVGARLVSVEAVAATQRERSRAVRRRERLCRPPFQRAGFELASAYKVFAIIAMSMFMSITTVKKR